MARGWARSPDFAVIAFGEFTGSFGASRAALEDGSRVTQTTAYRHTELILGNYFEGVAEFVLSRDAPTFVRCLRCCGPECVPKIATTSGVLRCPESLQRVNQPIDV